MKMQRWLELMQLILTDMREESKNCGVLEFVTSPVQVMPLEPSLFFGHGGWAVSFVRKQTVIWKRKLMRWKRLFLLLPEWADRYNYFVELGESLPAMPVAFQVPENRIACSSMLYFYVCHIQDLCYIFASANAAIPAGLAAMLFNLCDGVPRKDIRDNMPYLLATLKELGLIDNLTLSRRVALLTMVEKITNS